MNGLQQFIDKCLHVLRDTCGPPLKALHTPIDKWLGAVPMSFAMVCAIGLYLIAVVWVWGLKKEFVFRGAPGKGWLYDLRIWATLVVIPYVVAYLLLGR